MAMLDIEYRHSGRPVTYQESRRPDAEAMESYLRNIVFEMQDADISSKYIGKECDEDMLYINGMKVTEVLEGLEIKPLMPEEDECGCDGHAKPIFIGRGDKEWNTEFIEDIPDILVKNAISKVYCDIQKNRIM